MSIASSLLIYSSQYPIGHLASSSDVFKDIKHPHNLHLFDPFRKNSHVLHTARRACLISSEDRGCVGSNRSKTVTSSPISYILPYLTVTVMYNCVICGLFMRLFWCSISRDVLKTNLKTIFELTTFPRTVAYPRLLNLKKPVILVQ